MDRLEFDSGLRNDGYRVVNASVKPNQVNPNHCHDFDARSLVLGGEITITRDNIPTIFRAGQCFDVPTGVMHAECVGPEGVALLSGRRRNGPLTREAFVVAPTRMAHVVRAAAKRSLVSDVDQIECKRGLDVDCRMQR